jgi:hypothetical protein
MNAASLDQHLDSPRGCSPAWRLDWLTPGRCRVILAAVLLLGFLGHVHYLIRDCPIDLAPDEAQYWDWSRQLDLSYYSKGPLVAYVIRASCALFGDTMWAVRLPALVLATGTGLVSYMLTRRLFGSDRLALGVVLLCALVPMFIAGSVLMTIDPPFVFCWALATYLAVPAVLDGRRWPWPLIGIVVGVGFLAKYAMLLWLPSAFLAMALDPRSRRPLRTAGPWLAVAIALTGTIPVLVWNARHGWPTLWHVLRQTGADGEGGFRPANLLEFLGGQVGVLGPPVAVLMAAAVVFALSRRWADDPRRREVRFLVWIGLPFLLGNVLLTLLTKVQANWPAPAYVTLLILTAYFISTRLRDASRWKPWRPWVWSAVVLGIVATPVLHDVELLYPLVRWQHAARKVEGAPSARQLDPTVRLKGWEELGARVSDELHGLGPGAFVLCDDYMSTAEMAFYVAGQPKTYCAGSYFSDERRKRYTQWDVWPDRALDPDRQPAMLGRGAVYVGFMNDDVRAAFERVEGPFQLDIVRDGVKVRTFRYARCFGFRGMRYPAGGGKA